MSSTQADPAVLRDISNGLGLLCPAGGHIDPRTGKLWVEEPNKGPYSYNVGPQGKRIIHMQKITLGYNEEDQFIGLGITRFAPNAQPIVRYQDIYEDNPTHPAAVEWRRENPTIAPLAILKYYKPPGEMTYAEIELKEAIELSWPSRPMGACGNQENRGCIAWILAGPPVLGEERDMDFLYHVCPHKMRSLQKIALQLVNEERERVEVLQDILDGETFRFPKTGGQLRYEVPLSNDGVEARKLVMTAIKEYDELTTQRQGMESSLAAQKYSASRSIAEA